MNELVQTFLQLISWFGKASGGRWGGCVGSLSEGKFLSIQLTSLSVFSMAI